MNILGKILKGKKPFSFSMVKEIGKVDKYGNKDMTISYKIKFIDSARFMASSLSNLANNLAEGIFNKLFKEYFLEHENVNDNLIKYRCLSCNKNYLNKVDEKLKKRFGNTFKFSNNDINKFILLLTKGVYLCD